jgi:DnaJ-class molecular chaperone
MKKLVYCQSCSGRGWIIDEERSSETCRMCSGQGVIEVTDPNNLIPKSAEVSRDPFHRAICEFCKDVL